MAEARDPEVKERVLRICPHKCLFCGYSQINLKGSPVLDGAHIRPDCHGEQYDVPENMILLCPTHHREYDSCLIDFDTTGTIYCEDEENPLHLKKIQYDVEYVKRGFIEYHNKRYHIGKKYNL